MAELVKCSHCGRNVSSECISCPDCGRELREEKKRDEYRYTPPPEHKSWSDLGGTGGGTDGWIPSSD